VRIIRRAWVLLPEALQPLAAWRSLNLSTLIAPAAIRSLAGRFP
jgi:hypothetical protein